MLDDWKTAVIPERTRAALELLEYMTLHPMGIDATFINKLRNAGLDDPAIREAANVGFHYNLINRVADAFDFPVPNVVQKKRLASILNITGKLLRGSEADEIWVRGEDRKIRPPEVENGRFQLLNAEAKTAPKLRRGVEAYVTAQWCHERKDAEPIPNELERYLKKLSLYAYRITDKEVNMLLNAGYTDDTIYEITLVGSIGAALVGLEKVYEALYSSGE